MRAIIIGGDERSVKLGRLLEHDGHEVFPLALEKALPVQGPPDFVGADTVILPLPAERGGYLNAPLSEGKYKLRQLLEPLRPGTKVFAGMVGESLRSFCAERALLLRDYFEREEFQVKNALLTAEGAVDLLLRLDDRAICGRRILISGFGRIGRLLAPRLRAMGAAVTVAARSAADRARAEAMGCAAVQLRSCATAGYDFVVNTIPATVFGKAELEAFSEAKFVELASAPYGFDAEGAKALGKSLTLAPGLPAICAPESAAEAIRDTIYNILEE